MNPRRRNILNDIKLTAKYLMVKAQSSIDNPGYEDSDISDMMGFGKEIGRLITELDLLQAAVDAGTADNVVILDQYREDGDYKGGF